MGILYGLLSAVAFGMIPLFTLPLLKAGITTHTAIVYRFVIATFLLWLILIIRGESLRARLSDLAKIAAISTLYMLAVLLYFYSLKFIASGVAATIQFLYPVMVMLIMIFFFHEKFSWRMTIAVALAITGVAFLSLGPGLESTLVYEEQHCPGNIIWGVILSLLTGLGVSLYYIGIQVAKLQHISSLVLTFYVMFFGAILCLAYAITCDSLQWIGTANELYIVLMLAIVTGVISNLLIIMAIKSIGSTMTSILGVTEPLTAVLAGVLVFGESFSLQIALGIVLIIFSVGIVILRGRH